MTEEDIKKVEKELEKSFLAVGNKWSGVILIEHVSDRFLFMPIDGFPSGEPFFMLSDVDLNKPNLDMADRMKKFELKIGDDEIGTEARLFCRVEEGKKTLRLNATPNSSPY